MQRSNSRILTTHTGSLPRPRDLTLLYAARARGDAVDAAEIDRPASRRCGPSCAKQRDAGIDVGNNGEQQRNSFFLYLKARLSGLGGSWERPSRADVERYPDFKRMWTEQHASRTQVSALGGSPKAIGEMRYSRRSRDVCPLGTHVLEGHQTHEQTTSTTTIQQAAATQCPVRPHSSPCSQHPCQGRGPTDRLSKGRQQEHAGTPTYSNHRWGARSSVRSTTPHAITLSPNTFLQGLHPSR